MEWHLSEPETLDDSEDVAQLASSLSDVGVSTTELEIVDDLLRLSDPLGNGYTVKAAMSRLGASGEEADALVASLEWIHDPKAMPPGPKYYWGKDPEATYNEAVLSARRQGNYLRRTHLRRAILATLGFKFPMGKPTYEIVRIPVLVLAAPNTPGATVVWKTRTTTFAAANLELTLLGSSFGANKTTQGYPSEPTTLV
jgi:hypothetical protein